MKLFDLIEQVKIELPELNEQQRYMIHNAYSGSEWVSACKLFLEGITADSCMPSEVLVTLRGIQDYYRQHKSITHKQSLYIAHAMIDYWGEISLEIRCSLIDC
jgi:hypothetical protein